MLTPFQVRRGWEVVILATYPALLSWVVVDVFAMVFADLPRSVYWLVAALAVLGVVNLYQRRIK